MNNQLQPIRLNKFLAERIGVSRREADELITNGKITTNDKIATLGARVDKSDKIYYNNKLIPFETNYTYLAFHKPVGYVCSRRAQGDTPTLYELLPKEYQNLKTVGRLDKDSSGLILLTNDGDFAFRMTHPKFRKQKVYQVELNKSLEPLHQQLISDYGIMLEDGLSQFKIITLPDDNTKKDDKKLKQDDHRLNVTVILSEGRNRQIRRTFAVLGYKVTKLHRTDFGKYKLGSLKPGEYRVCNVEF